MNNPWFRLYSEAVDDEKLRLLAFEDRWHFIALLCCKNNGILDEMQPTLMRRKVAVKLGLDLRELGEVARRLAEVGLIDQETLQPIAWDKRQFKSDKDNTAAERQKRYRESRKSNALRNGVSNGDVTRPEQNRTETETDIPAKTNVLPISPKPEKRKTSIPPDFCVTQELRNWALSKGINNVDDHLEPFITTCLAKGYKYVDWHSAFQNAVRDDWAKITQRGRTDVPGKFFLDKAFKSKKAMAVKLIERNAKRSAEILAREKGL
jgi:hypothetical protein